MKLNKVIEFMNNFMLSDINTFFINNVEIVDCLNYAIENDDLLISCIKPLIGWHCVNKIKLKDIKKLKCFAIERGKVIW